MQSYVCMRWGCRSLLFESQYHATSSCAQVSTFLLSSTLIACLQAYLPASVISLFVSPSPPSRATPHSMPAFGTAQQKQLVQHLQGEDIREAITALISLKPYQVVSASEDDEQRLKQQLTVLAAGLPRIAPRLLQHAQASSASRESASSAWMAF